ncbi:ABC-2 family transporter protein [Actinomyces bovis]|uniref:ABC-2 family transporter protein n=1 Tax=Actinomyces bovis TaxID=1658 RepID=A0ABY1VL30_9ACTO|nr:ABC transporter permease [Actinomyces bovis]SPT52816.1 ABC-2 family transporter protein [Actinomyces bovis]VEG54871.1 ABC-2 family transporter protein [Actinomyces israelii]
MGSVFINELRRLVRAKDLLVWTLAFPLILTVIFMNMFAGIEEAINIKAVPLGVVQDAAYQSAPGLEQLVDGLADANSNHHYAKVTTYPTASEAEAAARAEQTIGYLAVEDGKPALHLTVKGNNSITSVVLRRTIDAYQQTMAQQRELLAAGASPEQLAALAEQRVFTSELQVTPDGVGSTTRYYFSLLAFTAGTGMLLSVTKVSEVMASSGQLGARRVMAGIPRWQVLGGVLGAAWLSITASMGIAFLFMQQVAQVSFGPRAYLAPAVILVSGLMACAAGAALGTVPRFPAGAVSGIVTLLSLFTGLYGTGAQRLADAVENNVPVLSWLNPLWQSTHGFYSLLYYDSLGPFLRNCAALIGMSALFLAIALLRMRRMSHDHL